MKTIIIDVDVDNEEKAAALEEVLGSLYSDSKKVSKPELTTKSQGKKNK